MSDRLVLRHTYDRGMAFDVSEHGNHGVRTGVTPGSGAFTGSFEFTGAGERIDVTPSPTLSQMRELRVKTRFWKRSETPSRRNNLVEAHQSFALYLPHDGALQATILDATGAWTGPASDAGLLTPDQWHEAEFHHDGISRGRLYLDGVLVAEHYDSPGPIRPIGPYGLAIGHWPDPDDRYTFDGYVDDVAIWRDDPADDVVDAIDECCLDRAGIDGLMAAVRGGGADAASLGALVQDILGLGTEIATAARGGTQARTEELSGLSRAAWNAFGARDVDGFQQAFGDVQSFLRTNIGDAELEAYGLRALDQIRNSPIAPMLFDGTGERVSRDWLRHLTGLLCLDDFTPPVKGKPDRPRRPRRPEGDPDTDGPGGKKAPPDWNIGGEDSGRDDPPRPDREGRHR